MNSSRVFSFVGMIIVLTACKVEYNNEDADTSCLGFGSPSINVFVEDSISGNVIDTARVKVISTSGSSTVEDDAVFINFDDGNDDSALNAYWTLLTLNANRFDIELSVIANGYDSNVTKGIEFVLDTTCGADNTIDQFVYLCPTGSSCL